MATKKALINRWLEEPGKSIDVRITQLLVDYNEAFRPIEQKAYLETGSCLVPKESLPPFDTQAIFDLLDDLPHRNEVANGRDLRGMQSMAGHEYWNFSDTDFSFLSRGYTRFFESKLDRAIFDGSQGRFDFMRGTLQKVSFRKVKFTGGTHTGSYIAANCCECDFTGAQLKRTSFHEGINLQGSCFAGADLTWAIMTGCDLRGCDFRGATLANTYIQETIIDKSTDFRGANLIGLRWQDRRDFSGNLHERGSDWRQGTYDATTLHD
jgi:uncharacterized protein YjbI with pentapeptide repeats